MEDWCFLLFDHRARGLVRLVSASQEHLLERLEHIGLY